MEAGSMILKTLFSIGSIICAWVVCTFIYRLYFHPLSRYPGPWMGQITDWYAVYHCLQDDNHSNFARLHAKYGKFVRYGPNRLSINSNQAWTLVYGKKANTMKSDWYDVWAVLSKDSPSIHTTRDKAIHTRKRRILSHSFSEKMLQTYEASLLSLVEKLTESIALAKRKSGWTSPVDMSHMFSAFSFDVMGEFCFGRSFCALDGDLEMERLLTNMKMAFKGMNTVSLIASYSRTVLNRLQLGYMYSVAPLFASIIKVFPVLLKDLRDYQTFCGALARDVIEKVEFGSCKPNVFSTLLKRSIDGSETFDSLEMESESALLVTAGSETTAVALSNTLFHLLNNPNEVNRLREELDVQFSSADEIRPGKTLNGCEYLSAAISESLRLSPVVHSMIQRLVLPGGLNIEGHHIPAGVDVAAPQSVVHRNPEYFPDALTFKPSRWIKSAQVTEESVHLAEASTNPFSSGAANCIGKAWALTEMKVAIARLVWLFDMEMERPKDTDDLDTIQMFLWRDRQAVDRFTTFADGPLVRFRLRQK
ncbi:cytochrome P450 [Patellaria atrata CBS 101060]|uniref:Cytochrome P450 n=1 Tax=Patellaria atrata CBS 101060 TaxID=1346257 RepID=A0A9P4S9M1_9PEZI|nr:cytochrome P450 [Patellaria atrata CBS 101060]